MKEVIRPFAGAAGHAPAGGSLDDLRRSNLSIVLGLVHANREISRAELTRATGLNRSTIATIVADLEFRGIVEAADPRATNRVGRPSATIIPTERIVAIAVNPELDATIISVVALGGRVLRVVRYENDRIPSAREVANAVAAVVAGMRPDLERHHHLVGIGVAVPGQVRSRDGFVNLAPHLEWVDEPLAEMITEATGLPTSAGNDAACGVVAEGMFGAGRGQSHLVFLNGGASGIGGGVIVGDSLLAGSEGFGGELGHTLVNSDGQLCHCGATGCLETEVTRAAFFEALGWVGSSAADLPDRLTSAADLSTAGRAEIERQLEFLAIALRNVTNTFNPGRIILGGFLADLHRLGGDLLTERVRATALRGPGLSVDIMASELRRDSLQVGAAELAFRSVLRDPAAIGAADGADVAAALA
ncbi:ROK family protein [Pseudolysinimonas sp.]|uniref:ROK family protein n=1 Tax=Pseudolysinimonas sp. TaxID=2680009 RepID=UPI00286CEB92|nr:ROK family protein [Pseudolysinimonas sp.]